MSRQPQKLQGEVTTKRQIVTIIIITGLLFGLWWSIPGIIDLFWGGSRSGYTSDQDTKTITGIHPKEIAIGSPTHPGIDAEIGDLGDLTMDQIMQLLQLLAGNLDSLDPSLMADLLASNPELLDQVMFRVYDYPNFADVQEKLFRMNVYDSFSDSDWSKTSTVDSPTVYQNTYIPPDVTAEYRIRMPLDEITPGEQYSVAVPGMSPETFIRTGSVAAQNPALDPASVQTPYIDAYGVKSLNPRFTTSNSQNLSLQTWAFERAGGNYYYNVTTQANPSIISAEIRNQYLTFPGGVTGIQYRSSRPAFAAATVEVQNRFNQVPGANLFVKANIIRTYIQDSFYCDSLTPSEAADIVEDTCETKVGDYFGIASTYIMLARYFQIPARFATGYSGLGAIQSVDPKGNPTYSGPANTIEIKIRNMYAWAETFMPLQMDGTGDWVPIDVLHVRFSAPPLAGNTMRIFVDGTEFNPIAPMYSIDRPATVNITADVTVGGAPYNGSMTLYDLLEEQTLDTITTSNGRGVFLWNVTTAVIAGGHAIRVTAGPAGNFTGVGVRGPLNLEFVDRIPDTIIRPSPYQDLRVLGYLEDVAYTGSRPNNRIPKANITVTLFTNPGNNPVPNPFNPATIKTNETGEFATNVTLDPSVVQGLYDVRLNFPGMFTFTLPGVGLASAFVSGMSAISITKSLQVIDPIQVVFDIYLNGTSNSVYDTIYNEGQMINASVHILVGGAPFVTSVNFDILDNKNFESPFAMGTKTTNGEGWANATWTVLPTSYTGPAVVRARFDRTGMGDIHYAYAFCFLNRSTTLYLSTITPDTTIDINSNPNLGFTANINDSNGRAVQQAMVNGVIYDKGSNLASFNVVPGVQFTGPSGNAVWSSTTTRVQGTGNFTFYDLRCEFYGVYSFSSHLWADDAGTYPGVLGVPGATSNNSIKREIFITDSSMIDMCNLWVNGTPAAAVYGDGNIGVFNIGSTINFTARCRKGGVFNASEPVDFYDVTQPYSFTRVYTNSQGWATLMYVVPASWVTGPHEITMTYRPYTGQRSNFTVVFLNDTIHLDNSKIYVDQPKITRDVTTVHITGALKDVNGQGVYRASVNLKLFDNTLAEQFGDISGDTTVETDKNGNFTFTVTLSESLLQGAYKFRVDYEQVINANYFSNCPTYLTGTNKLNPVISPYADVTVNATIQISGASYTPTNQLRWSYFSVSGTFAWDNNTALQSSYASWITIRITETGNPSNVLATVTIVPADIDAYGSITKSIQLTWEEADWTVTWILTPSDAYVSRGALAAIGV